MVEEGLKCSRGSTVQQFNGSTVLKVKSLWQQKLIAISLKSQKLQRRF
jgi:hypothetical protein